MRKFLFLTCLAGTLLNRASSPQAWSQAVLTYGYSNMRLGANTHETVLTPTNVNVNTFGKKFSYSIDGFPYGQVLYVPNLSVNGILHNVVYVVTENNSVYAFDADGGGQIWHQFIDTPVPCAPIHGCGVAPALGITATPVIDLSLKRIFVESRTAPQGGGYWHGLHAFDLATGQEAPGSPVVIDARVRGTGYDHDVNGYINFNSQTENDRSALLEVNGVIYVSFASTGDADPYHGWVLGYSASNLQLLYTFCVTPNGSRGGIWGGPLAADNSGHIFAAVGNGTWDGITEWGTSYLKLTPVGNTLQVSDYFTPFNYQNLNAEDLDLGSAAATLLPWLGGIYPHEMIGAGKEGRIYVINRDNMGKFHQGDDSQIIQEIPNALGQHTNHIYERSYSTPAYWGGWVYFIATDDNVRSFKLSNGMLTTSPTAISPETFPFPGANATISANGSTNGILWAVQRGSPPVLRAYKANNVAHELYNTAQNSSRDGLPGSTPKFTPPLVVNGNVYVGTNTQLTVYGLR